MTPSSGLAGPAAALAAFLLAGSAEAQVASAWRTVRSGQSVDGVVASRAVGGILRLSCAGGRSIWLNYHPPRTWNGNGAVAVRIGDAAFPMTIDGGDGAILSNVAGGLGITRAMVDRLKAGGGTAVLEGTATARVPAAQRSFTLAGAAEAVAAVERGCPGFR